MEYVAFARSAMGFSHRISGLPNQDRYSVSYLPEQKGRRNDDLIKVRVISVADGHGSPKCKWSHIGSQIAVDVFFTLVSDIYSESPDEMNKFFDNLSSIRHDILPKRIVKCWQELVIADYFKKVNKNPSLQPNDPNDLSRYPEIFERYGTTLLGLVLTDDFYFAIQIGDGDILAISQNEYPERVIKIEKLLGVETKSLSSVDAWIDFEAVPIKPLNKNEMPTLFLLSTDGLANSYKNDEEFFKIGNDYLDLLRANRLNISCLNSVISFITHQKWGVAMISL